MRSKPKGPKYRNLYASGSRIYYERLIDGKRFRMSTRTDDWDQAASVRDTYEAKKKLGLLAGDTIETPCFAEFAKRYLKEDTAHLAPTTRSDRSSYLRTDGPLGFFGQLKLHDISPALLRTWWGAEIEGKRSTRTGRAYLDVLSSVLAYAQDLELLETSPVPAFREMLRRRNRTQRGRAEATPGRHVHPIEKPKEIKRLVKAARREGQSAYILVLLLLDAGLRLGEAIGLRWGKLNWGRIKRTLLAPFSLTKRGHVAASRDRPRAGVRVTSPCRGG